MTERDLIYVEILRFGLISLRNHAVPGGFDYCAIEAEHLHEVPSLIGEVNEGRHEYYLRGHRQYYLERIDQSEESLGFVLRRYHELWPELEAIHAKMIGSKK